MKNKKILMRQIIIACVKSLAFVIQVENDYFTRRSEKEKMIIFKDGEEFSQREWEQKQNASCLF